MNTAEKSTIAITGPREGVGQAVAEYYGQQRDRINLALIGSRQIPLLEQMGTRLGASEVAGGDIFDPESPAYQRAMTIRPRVLVQNAAFNMDTMDGPDKVVLREQKNLSRQRQTDYFRNLLDAQISDVSDQARLLINVNSITSLSESGASKYPYMGMKRDQAQYAEEKRPDLKRANVRLVQIRPGAIRTGMMGHLPDDDRAVALANILMKRVTAPADRPQGYAQDFIFQREEIAGVITQLSDYFLEHGDIPEHLLDIAITNHQDLKLLFDR